MSGDIVGRPAGAVLIPPQAARFASLTGADPDRDFDFGEWGTGLWRRHRRDFSALWAQGWHAYARA